MEKARVVLLVFCILIQTATCHQNITNIELFVGPRHNETGRYLYKININDMTSSKSRGDYKHCLYCDNSIAFVNTSMNELHQAPQCIQNNYNIPKDRKPQQETGKGLSPYCKLGDVPVCGPLPYRENIQRCDRGYSDTPYSMYFSCLISNRKQGIVLSEYYCNENLQWELLRDYEEGVTINSTTERIPKETTTNVVTKTSTTPETEHTTTEYQAQTSEERETVTTSGAYLAVILAGVLSVITIVWGVILLRYLLKRRRRRNSRNSPSKTAHHQHPSQSYPVISPSGNKHGNGSLPEESVSLISTTPRYTSSGPGQTDVEAGPAISVDTCVQQSAGSSDISGREPPVGQENFPVQVTQPENINETQASTREDLNKSQTEDLNTNRSVSPEINLSLKEQNRCRVNSGTQTGSLHDCKSDGKFHRVSSRTEDQRQEPVGKVSEPQHDDENRHVTEPKRIVSVERMDQCGTENDDSFEINTGSDSGVHMNIWREPCRMLDLKQQKI